MYTRLYEERRIIQEPNGVLLHTHCIRAQKHACPARLHESRKRLGTKQSIDSSCRSPIVGQPSLHRSRRVRNLHTYIIIHIYIAYSRNDTRDVIANDGLPLMRLMAAHDAARVQVPSGCPLHRLRLRRPRRDRRDVVAAGSCRARCKHHTTRGDRTVPVYHLRRAQHVDTAAARGARAIARASDPRRVVRRLARSESSRLPLLLQVDRFLFPFSSSEHRTRRTLGTRCGKRVGDALRWINVRATTDGHATLQHGF